jgi:NAD(P)-dependent dehydrogenase (short-subunit alcohol dehydrogenase family)
MSAPVAIVTGAARGIGRATARSLHRAGFRLILNGRSTAELQTLEAELPGSLAVAVDLLEAETPARLVRAALDRFGRLDAQVNAAGMAKMAPLLEIDPATWQSFFDLHLTASFRCSQAAARALVEQNEGGAIVNIGSVAASMAMYGTGAYAAAKAAVASYSRVLAVELAPHQIRVNTVAPGPVATEQLRQVYAGPKYAERSRSIPLNRLAEPEEVADLIAFLVSPAASYITGQTFTIDGGASAVGCYSYETYKRQGPQ